MVLAVLAAAVCGSLAGEPPAVSIAQRLQALAGGKLPGTAPVLFGAGKISTGLGERDVAVSPAGDEVFYSLMTGRQNTILHTRFVQGKWTEPEIAAFARDERYYSMEPCFAGSSRLFFLSTRPPAGQAPKPRWGHQNIWAVDRRADGSWGDAYELDPANINRPGAQYFPSVTRDGTLYFTRVEGAGGKPAIYRARPAASGYGPAERLPASVNREGTSPFNAAIAPDESLLVVPIEGREHAGNPGRANYYVFFRDAAGRWSDGVALGAEVNIPGSTAMSASFSPDGRYFFFAAQALDARFGGTASPRTLSAILDFFASPRNGNYDIYWADASLIQALRPR